ESPYLPAEELLQADGNPPRRAIDGTLDVPSPVAHRQEATGDEVVEHAHHEERVTLRALIEERRDALGLVGRLETEPRRDVFRHVRPRQQLERERFAEATREELVLDGAEWMVVYDHVGGPEAGGPHEMRRSAAARDAREPVDRRRVAPLQVLEHEHERPPARELLEGIRDFPQHASGMRRQGGTVPGSGRAANLDGGP